METREQLLRKLSGAQFAAQEMRLYLDTHNADAKATAAHQSYCKAAADCKADYEKLYGPLTACDLYGETNQGWLNAPWPWENESEANR